MVSWKTHEELDDWHNENIESYEDFSSLLKAFHRAFQLRNDMGYKCPQRQFIKFYFILILSFLISFNFFINFYFFNLN